MRRRQAESRRSRHVAGPAMGGREVITSCLPRGLIDLGHANSTHLNMADAAPRQQPSHCPSISHIKASHPAPNTRPTGSTSKSVVIVVWITRMENPSAITGPNSSGKCSRVQTGLNDTGNVTRNGSIQKTEIETICVTRYTLSLHENRVECGHMKPNNAL